jgi:hypothetical protein
MDDAARRQLSETWTRNEAELQRLPDLPAGAIDPAERERHLDTAQDGIEGDLGVECLGRRHN